VKHGYVKNPAHWRYSSIHRFMNEGVIDESWAYVDDLSCLLGFTAQPTMA